MPKELKAKCHPITLHVDSRIVSGCVFLDSVGKPMHFEDSQAVENKKKETFHALDHTIHQCAKTRCIVQTISCDKEFKALMDPGRDDMNVNVDTSTPEDHESSEEHIDHNIQEWHHAASH